MDTGKIMAKTTTTTIETFTLSDTHDKNKLTHRTILNSMVANDSAAAVTDTVDADDDEDDEDNDNDNAGKLTTNDNNNESSNESIDHKSVTNSPTIDFDQLSTMKNKRKNFQPRSSCNSNNKIDKDDEISVHMISKMNPKQTIKSNEMQQQQPQQPNYSNNAFNAVKELLSVYGLTMSPNDIVDAFSKTIETTGTMKQSTNACKYSQNR